MSTTPSISHKLSRALAGARMVATNESLDAVTAGLALTSRDVVLAVAGSGDPVFACLEYADRVVTTDLRIEQVRLVHERARALWSKDYALFLAGKNSDDQALTQERTLYFGVRGRLDRIAAHKDGFVLGQPQDIRRLADEFPIGAFSKMYLSNAWAGSIEKRGLAEVIAPLGPHLAVGGLVYCSTIPADYGSSIPLPEGRLCERRDLSRKAQDLERAFHQRVPTSPVRNPMVYERAA